MSYTLITGASGGIGKELAKCAAKDGRKLVLVARNKKALHALADELPVKTVIVEQDLAKPEAADELIVKLKKRKVSDIEILINNAGFGDYGNFARSDANRQESMIILNILSLTKLTRLLLPSLIKNKGRVINLGSVASFFPGSKMSVYFASKAYVLSFSEALYEELKPLGVSVTCLCPGPTSSNFAHAAETPKKHYTNTARTTSKDVAEFGWKMMKSGKPVAIYGRMNRLAIYSVRFLPRAIIRKIVKWNN